jgi:aminopeptidase N
VGEEAFRRGLTDFQARHRYGKAGTEELREALETASGMKLGPYFEEWVRRTSIPVLGVTYNTVLVAGQFHTNVRLKAPALPGPVSLLVSVSYAGGREERRMMVGPEGGTLTVVTPAKVARVEVNADRALLARTSGG